MILKSTNDLIRGRSEDSWFAKKKVPIPYLPFFCLSSAFPSARFAGGALFPEKLKRNVAFCQPNNFDPTKHYL